MKLRWFDRVLIGVAGLVLTALAVLTALVGCGRVRLPEFLSVDMVRGGWQWTPVFLIAAVLIALWGIRLIVRSLRRGRGKRRDYFSVQTTDDDSLQISVSAIEKMVQRCVDQNPGAAAASIRVYGGGDALQIDLRATVRSDVRIPETVTELRDQIRRQVEERSGVPVRNIHVSVEGVREVSSRKKEGLRLLPEGRTGEAAPDGREGKTVKTGGRVGNNNEETVSASGEIPGGAKPSGGEKAAPEKTEDPARFRIEESRIEEAARQQEEEELFQDSLRSEAEPAEDEKPASVEAGPQAQVREEEILAEAARAGREAAEKAVGEPEELPVKLSSAAFPFPER